MKEKKDKDDEIPKTLSFFLQTSGKNYLFSVDADDTWHYTDPVYGENDAVLYEKMWYLKHIGQRFSLFHMIYGSTVLSDG